MSKIMKELSAAADLERKPNETDDHYVKAVVRVINFLDDDEWEKLSDAAQDYANTVVDCIKEKREAPPPPDAEDEADASDDAEEPDDDAPDDTDATDDDSEPEEEAGDPDPGPEKPAATATRTRRSGGDSRLTATTRIKEILLEQGLDMKALDIAAQLKREGFTAGDDLVRAHCYGFRKAVEILNAHGYLAKKPKGLKE